MTYRQAKRLRIGDAIERKRNREPLTVTKLEIQEKDVFIRADNGRLYHHTAVQSSERR